jgi:hypothetical protein
MTKNIYGFHVKYPYSCQILMKLEFSQQIFEKYLEYQISLNPFSGRKVFLCRQTDGWTDRHAESNSRFSRFCEGA